MSFLWSTKTKNEGPQNASRGYASFFSAEIKNMDNKSMTKKC